MVDNVTVTREELLNCPFCGGEAHLMVGVRDDHGFAVQCERLYCKASTRGHPTEAQAINRWNSRLSPAPEGVDARELLAASTGCHPSEFGLCRMVPATQALHAIEAALALSSPPAEQVRMREALESIANDVEAAVAGGMSWISHSEAYEFSRRVRSIAAALTPPPKGQNDHG